MNKNILWLIVVLVSLSFGFASCAEDTQVEDPYANWQARNEHYLDSIVDVARANADGRWYCVQNWKIWNDGMAGTGGIVFDDNFDMTDSVYVHFRSEPVATGSAPLYTDSITTYYRGSLINGEQFDSNYQGDWDDVQTPQIYTPRGFLVSGLITGWQTALMASHDGSYPGMKPGDNVDIYIPYQLGYGASGYLDIRGYSVLSFHMKLVSVTHPEGPDDRSLMSEIE